ncbi:MAG TPA: FAD-dependent oxidoreductase [Acidimicrobiia bacterium]|nr:FAD-dependent oxidoreductase [Acidimicrobiia bacterium]
MKQYDVAIIGGGVHGLFTAYALARRGKSVVVCEQYEFGHLRGSSHGATRIYRLSYDDPDYVKLALNALSLWRQIEDEAQVSLIDSNGCVDHGGASAIASRVNSMDQCGVVSEVITPEEAKYRWPNLEFDETVVFHPGGGRIYARATLTALRELCSMNGVVLRDFFPIKKMFDDSSGQKVLESENESLSASVVVCAAGAWTPELLQGIIDIPVPKISQEQSLYFASRDPGAIWPNIFHHRDTTFYSQEAPGVGVLVSGVRMGTYIDKVEERDFIVDPLVAIKVCDYVSRFMPGLDDQPLSSDTCVATFARNNDFLIDRVGNIVVIMACQQTGFMFSPIVAKYAADLVTEKQFSQLRFRLP